MARRDFDFDRWPAFSGRMGEAPFGYTPFMPMTSRHRWPAYEGVGWPTMPHSPSPWVMQARQRFMDMERKFEQFMRKVDER